MLVRPKVDSTTDCSGLVLTLQSSSSGHFRKAHTPPAGTRMASGLDSRARKAENPLKKLREGAPKFGSGKAGYGMLKLAC